MSTLYFSRPGEPSLQQILVAARLLNLSLPTQEINKKYDPLLLVTPEGVLNQPNAILLYLADGQLTGHTPSQQQQLWQWLEHFNLELAPLLTEISQQLRSQKAPNQDKYNYAVREVQREL